MEDDKESGEKEPRYLWT